MLVDVMFLGSYRTWPASHTSQYLPALHREQRPKDDTIRSKISYATKVKMFYLQMSLAELFNSHTVKHKLCTSFSAFPNRFGLT